MTTNAALRTAGTIVGLEALGLAGLAAWQVVAWAGGDVGSPVTAAALLVMTVVAAVALGAVAVAILRGRAWGRSGGIVAQLLIGAVALGALTGSYAHPMIALALAAPAIAAFALLLIGSRAAAEPMSPDTSD